MKNIQQSEFDDKKYPAIKLFDNHFEIKAIDYWEFRSFNDSNVVEVEYAPVKIWWGLGKLNPFFSSFWYGKPYCALKITLQKGVVWDYKVLGEYSPEYAKVVEGLINKIGLHKE